MGLCNHIRRIRANSLHIRKAKVTQKFNITFRALHRREGQSENLKSQFIGQRHKVI